MSRAFDTVYDIFKTFTKLVIQSPIIQNAKDTLHTLIKKFANSSDDELVEIQYQSEQYLQSIAEEQSSEEETSSEWEDEEEM